MLNLNRDELVIEDVYELILAVVRSEFLKFNDDEALDAVLSLSKKQFDDLCRKLRKYAEEYCSGIWGWRDDVSPRAVAKAALGRFICEVEGRRKNANCAQEG